MDTKPGDVFVKDGAVYQVVSVSEAPTMTLVKLTAPDSLFGFVPRVEIHGTIDSPIFDGFKKLQ